MKAIEIGVGASIVIQMIQLMWMIAIWNRVNEIDRFRQYKP